MPIQKTKGIRGLEGLKKWDDLSEKEKQDYLATYPSLGSRTIDEVSNIFDNTQYVKEFGRDDFLAHPDKEERDARLKSTLVGRAKDSLLSEDFPDMSEDENSAFTSRVRGLTDDGFIELANSDFNFPSDLKELNSRKDETDKFRRKHSFLSGLAESNELEYGMGTDPFEKTVEFNRERNATLLNEIAAKDDRRKQQLIAPFSQQYRNMFDTMSPEKVEEEFDKIFEGQQVRTGYKGENGEEVDYETPGVGLYKEFKDQDEMAGFGLADKKKFLADFYAANQTFGGEQAMSLVTTELQDYIAGNQDAWDWIGSAARGAAGKFLASFGQLMVGTEALAGTAHKLATEGMDAADQWLADFMQGKDENGEDRSWWSNVRYWNGMDQFGVLFDSDRIKEIEANGNISHYNYLTRAGEEMNLSSALNEGLKMLGYMAAQAVTARGVGALGKGAARLAGGAFSEVTGLYNAALSSNAANIIMKYVTPGIASALNAIPISVGYAKGSYDTVYQEAIQRADYEAEKAVTPTIQNLTLDVARYLKGEENNLTDADKSAMMAWVSREMQNRGISSEEDYEELWKEAASNYLDFKRNQLLEDYKGGEQYQLMMDAARKEAASAYERNATIEWLRMCGVNYLFKQWQQDKSVRAAMNSNYPNLDVVSRDGRLAATGKIFGVEVSPQTARWVQPLKTVWGGFESNYMDDITAAYSKGFSLGRYNDYVNQVLGSEPAAATISWVAGFTNALASAEKAFGDKQSWYDGFIGALGSSEMVAPGASARAVLSRTGRSGWSTKLNYSQTQLASMASKYGLSTEEYINGEFEGYVERTHPNFSEAQVKKEADKIRREDGLEAAIRDGRIERVSFPERLNKILYNPLLAQYSESAERERDFKAIIDGGNKAIAEKKQAIEDLIKVAYVANRKGIANKSDSTYEGKEAKALEAFTLVSMLSRWMQDPVLSQSEFVQNSWADVERMAKGEANITQEDIESFFASAQNKSERDRVDAEEFAKQRLVSNAKQLVRTKENYDKATKFIRDSKQFRVIASHNAVDYVTEQLAFDDTMWANRDERATDIASKLGINRMKADNPVAQYGSIEGAQEVAKSLEEEIESAKKEREKILGKIKNRNAYKSTTRSLRRLRKQGDRLALQEIDRQIDATSKELSLVRNAISENSFNTVLSKEQILNLPPQLLARMLDRNNKSLYSKEQRAEIEAARQELEIRGKDKGITDVYEAVQDIAKLENALDDTYMSSRIMRENPEAAADYYEYAQKQRYRRLYDALERHHYREVEKSVVNAADDTERRMLARGLSSTMLERLIKEHPEYADMLKDTQKIAEVSDDTKHILNSLEVSEAYKIRERVREDLEEDTQEDINKKQDEINRTSSIIENMWDDILRGVLFNSRVYDESSFMGELEELADRQVDPRVKELYQKLLEALEDAKHSRNATVVQAKKARKEAEARQDEYYKSQDGKNFGWDGYKVGDKVWRNDGTEGEVKGFVSPAKGETKGAIQILWTGETNTITYTDDSQFSKTEPREETAKKATQDAINAINDYQNADTNIDKLDAVVAFEKAVAKGATVSEDAKAVIDKAKKELEDNGIDYRIYLNQPETNSTEEEILEDSGHSFTSDGGLITQTPQEEYNDALLETDAPVSDVPNDSVFDTENTRQSNKNYRAEEGLLEGNGLYEYNVDTLKDLGIVERRVPEKAGDVIDSWFKFLDANQIQLQEIIDRELGRILKKNPDTKIRFVISNDPLTTGHIIQVVEYTSDVEKIHDDSLGGVITATDGKEEKRYLVVGSTYSHIGKDAYNAIGNPLKNYIKKNPNTPFYVHPTIYSKVAKMDAGRLIRQQKEETEIHYRTLGELFADQSRNPSGISFDNAIFGIMYNKEHIVYNRSTSAKLFGPGKSDATLGRLFLMIPAANGNYIPVAIKTDMYLNSPELKSGVLTDKIDTLLRMLTSRQLGDRKQAIIQLSRLIKFDSEGGKIVNGILVGSEEVNNLTLVLNGNKVATWNLDSQNFDAANFIQTIKNTAFRINISQWMLNPENVDTLLALDEAGVLRTDVSTLRTGNVAYQIFPVDAQGKPVDIKVKEAKPESRKLGESRRATSTPPINGRVYRYTQNDYFDDLGKRVEDTELRKSIHYNLYIERYGLSPSYISSETGLYYYTIVNNPDNPTIVSRDEKNNITVLSKERAKRLLSTIQQEAEIKARRDAAAAEVKRIQEGKEGIKGEEWEDKETSKQPVEQAPAKLTYIEPKHDDSVTYGPAIRESKVFIKHEGDVSLELHPKTTVNEDGTKTTKIVGWGQNGLEYAIPSNSPMYLDIPSEYKVPEGALPEGSKLLGFSEIEEGTDGALKGKAHYKEGLGYSYGWISLERQDAPVKPKRQSSIEKEVLEKPKVEYDPNKATTKSLEELEKERKTPTFDMLFFDREEELYTIAESKGWDIGDGPDAARETIENKLKESYPNEKIDLDAINDVDNLMEMIRNCK